MTRILFRISFAIAIAATSTARADDVEEARKYFEAGKQAYDAGQYAVSITAFEEAYKLAPRSTIVFSLGHAYRRQYSIDHDDKKLVRAGALYRQYLSEIQQGDRRDEAARYLGEIEPLLVRIEDEAKQKAAAAATPPPEATAAVPAPDAPPAPAPAVAPAPPPPPPPPATQIMISSQTRTTRGSIDGGALSEIPVIAEVKPGPHKVHVEADGYFAADADATAVDGRLVVAELNLKEKPAQLVVNAPSGAEISVDGRTVGTTPIARPIELPAGSHLVIAALRGHTTWSREIALTRGQSATLTATLPRTNQRRLAYATFGVAGLICVGAGVTTAIDLGARSDASSLDAKIAGGGATPADLAERNRLASRANTFATASQILAGSAAIVAVTGAMLYYFDVSHPEATGIVPALSPSGGSVSWVGRF